MKRPVAFRGAQVFDGKTLLSGRAVLVSEDQPSIIAPPDIPAGTVTIELSSGILMPGFVDLQVNGGGGVMFNDRPSLDSLRTMSQAHAGLGTRAFLPTLITDTPAATQNAIAAVVEAIEAGVPGVVGLHLEGPHLDPARKGAHAGSFIRPMTDDDLNTLLTAARQLPNLLVTLAPENVTRDQISTLAAAGVCVSLGHSDSDFETACAYFEAGAQFCTHLFNAMSPLTSRAPGVVGAALDSGAVSCGLIADGIHVHPATIRAALAAKRGPGQIFLVTDAMATAGSDIKEFTLNDRQIRRSEDKLTLADGTLAGAHLSMARALQVMMEDVGDSAAQALARATSIPAQLLKTPMGAGGWPEKLDDLIYLTPDFEVQSASTLIARSTIR